MRPVQKPSWPKDASGSPKSYKPHTLAKPDLEEAIGCYCSYCEEFHSNLQVEHVISVDQDSNRKHDWDNFLLACSRCNGRDNKSNKSVDLSQIHFPHRDNTLHSLIYREGGLIQVNPALEQNEWQKALALVKLVGLDKHPANPEYPNFPIGDNRWKTRREQWEVATRKRKEFDAGLWMPAHIVEFAKERGYFSVWFTLFEGIPEVRKALMDAFSGTAPECFDADSGYRPIPRPQP